MSEDDIEIDLDDLSRRMDGAIASLRTEFASLRTGRASASIFNATPATRFTMCWASR